MDPLKLKAMLDAVAAGELVAEQAFSEMRKLPFEDLGFAKLDHHRALRMGYPETIYCAGKTVGQVVEIVASMQAHGSNVLATRCTPEQAAAVLARFPEAVHHEMARTLTLQQYAPEALPGYIGVVCAGTSDIPVAEEAVVTLESMGNTTLRIYDVGVAGLQRLLSQREALEGANVLVVCAGMEGALPSVVGGLVECPVIAVPTSIGYGANFGGLSALLGMLNSCATGLSVVNIDNGFGGAVAATAINRMIHKANKAHP